VGGMIAQLKYGSGMPFNRNTVHLSTLTYLA